MPGTFVAHSDPDLWRELREELATPAPPVRYIGFSGHRDRLVIPSELDLIARLYPGATWVHGGAKGIDTQVRQYAERHGIQCLTVAPAYDLYPGKLAPLKRNELIVDICERVFVGWDGRRYGGTFYTYTYAVERARKPVGKLALVAKEIPHGRDNRHHMG